MFFLLFGRGLGPRPNSKKKTRPRPNSKKNNTRNAQTTKKPDNKKNKHSYRLESPDLELWILKGLAMGKGIKIRGSGFWPHSKHIASA